MRGNVNALKIQLESYWNRTSERPEYAKWNNLQTLATITWVEICWWENDPKLSSFDSNTFDVSQTNLLLRGALGTQKQLQPLPVYLNLEGNREHDPLRPNDYAKPIRHRMAEEIKSLIKPIAFSWVQYETVSEFLPKTCQMLVWKL